MVLSDLAWDWWRLWEAMEFEGLVASLSANVVERGLCVRPFNIFRTFQNSRLRIYPPGLCVKPVEGEVLVFIYICTLEVLWPGIQGRWNLEFA